MNDLDFGGLLFIVGTATSLVKLIVDGLKMALPDVAPRWVISAAFLSGILISFLLMLYAGQELTTQTTAGGVLAGIMAAGGAIGLTAAHTAARPGSSQEDKKVP